MLGLEISERNALYCWHVKDIISLLIELHSHYRISGFHGDMNIDSFFLVVVPHSILAVCQHFRVTYCQYGSIYIHSILHNHFF
jgi:hypothetical protein